MCSNSCKSTRVKFYFRVGATFEMIRTESDEMCIWIDQDWGGAAPFIRREIKQGSGETERENVCACECWSKPKIASISIHKQHGERNTWKHIW